MCVSPFHTGANEENTEEASATQHLTSDSDSEVYCDSMEQLGLEEVGVLLSLSRWSGGWCLKVALV